LYGNFSSTGVQMSIQNVGSVVGNLLI